MGDCWSGLGPLPSCWVNHDWKGRSAQVDILAGDVIWENLVSPGGQLVSRCVDRP
ncbi:hypothetical protein HMPREF9622_01592 [Cutibacterium modestum HL037PA3]|uniref:Uncharacterized protein n=1 Tax=Cutibacterium modestum HL044PA1 TaxID=765109 RepID=A0ABP2KAM5_9ACTN|nr:hypothetical protein HMPREF9621_01623 [Cutibacterium modestum HL037PA2]EFS92666.1 hypothetical protein HMPREF9607_01197 [Cutibacterium modestum HL044PA1]EFT15386.1 hypothetical protein HMPREF9622_01592 [Cutibacterium modestum HL037PA3]